MGHRWEACPAIMLIEGRGLVRCWLPPSPGRTLCAAHHPGSNVTAGDPELRAIVAALLKEIHAEADLGEFIRLPGEPHCALRVGWPGVVAKWVIVPEGMIRLASVNLTARRALRNLLATIVMVQQAQRALNQSRELLAESG
jgi:hypothetical protein